MSIAVLFITVKRGENNPKTYQIMNEFIRLYVFMMKYSATGRHGL